MTSGYNKKAEERAQWREMEDVIFQQKAMIAELEKELGILRVSEAENIALLDSVKEMQQITARQSTCPYVLSSDEGTQSCRLNGALESALEAIEKDLDSFGYATYEMTSFLNAPGGRSYQFYVAFGESVINAHERITFPKTSILEAATDCLEVIAEVLKRLGE